MLGLTRTWKPITKTDSKTSGSGGPGGGDPPSGRVGAEIAEQAPDCLLAPITRVAGPNTPAPFAPALEKRYVPQPQRIAEAARRLVREY